MIDELVNGMWSRHPLCPDAGASPLQLIQQLRWVFQVVLMNDNVRLGSRIGGWSEIFDWLSSEDGKSIDRGGSECVQENT
jgi:hypothetical protein